jgi:YVTN family beta-propeller protein
MRTLKIALTFTLALAATLQLATAQTKSGFHVSQRFAVGGDGGWDYLTFDAAANRLYISRSTRVLVVDTEAGKLVGEIPGTAGVHGIAIVPKLGRGLTSNGKDNSATIFDLKTLKILGTVKTGSKPDAIVYDAFSGHVFVGNGKSNDITVIDPEKAEVVATIALEGNPEFIVSDGSGKVFVNLESAGSTAVIDAKANRVLNNWKLEGCDEPTGLSMDIKNRRLFAGCHNEVLVALDADTGKNLAKLPVGKGLDATAYDPELQLVFTSNGAGTVTVIKQQSPDSYTVVENVATARGSKTMALDKASHKLYLGAVKFAEGDVAAKPAALPNSFEVLVVTK